MQNAEIKLVRLDDGDVITTSGQQTFTLANFWDEGAAKGTITSNFIGTPWVNNYATDDEGIDSAINWLEAALGLTDYSLNYATAFSLPGQEWPQSLSTIVEKDSAQDDGRSVFNTTYIWNSTKHQFEYYQ